MPDRPRQSEPVGAGDRVVRALTTAVAIALAILFLRLCLHAGGTLMAPEKTSQVIVELN